MGDRTRIEWTDATVNAVNGCSLASPGCTNCYAMRLAGTRMKHHPSRAGLTQDRKAGLRCIEGRLFRHDPQYDDPDLETDIGQCPDCSGDGCGDDGEPVSKAGRSAYWLAGLRQ